MIAERPAHIARAIDEGALIDALAYLEQVRGTDDEEFAEEQVRSIRRRLDDFGAAVEERIAQGVRFVRTEPYRYDPAGTVRYAVHRPGEKTAQHDGQIPFDDDLPEGYEFPRGPRNQNRSTR